MPEMLRTVLVGAPVPHPGVAARGDPWGLRAHRERRRHGPAADDGVNDGARTRDFRHHKPALYQLSYAHHAPEREAPSVHECSGRTAGGQTPAATAASAAAAFASSEVGPGRGAKTVCR